MGESESKGESKSGSKRRTEAAQSQSVAVRIAGHEYKIRSEDSKGVREISAYVDRAMCRVRDRTGTVDTLDVAVLTCLNLAREILTLRGERLPQGAMKVDESKLQALIERVEGVLPLDLEALGSEPSDSEEAELESEEPEAQADAHLEAPRTLELPSVETLRERTFYVSDPHVTDPNVSDPQATDSLADGSGEALPEARVASAGRDRAS